MRADCHALGDELFTGASKALPPTLMNAAKVPDARRAIGEPKKNAGARPAMTRVELRLEDADCIDGESTIATSIALQRIDASLFSLASVSKVEITRFRSSKNHMKRII